MILGSNTSYIQSDTLQHYNSICSVQWLLKLGKKIINPARAPLAPEAGPPPPICVQI